MNTKRVSFAVGGVLALAGLVGTPAFAADLPLPVKAPIVAPLAYSWTGFYIGGNIGGMWTSGDLTDRFFDNTIVTFGGNKSGFMGGGQVGYNYQMGSFVIGVEWDGDWSNLSGNGRTVVAPLGTFVGFAGTNWDTTLAARFGFAADRWLFYGKAGGGWVNNKVTITNTGNGLSWSANHSNSGWLLGAGVEYAFTYNWTAKLEFDYIGLSSWNTSSTLFVLPDRVSLSRNVEMVKFGVNYKF